MKKIPPEKNKGLKALSDAMRHRMIDKEMSQAELATASGVCKQTISNLVCRKLTTSMNTIDHLCKSLDLEIKFKVKKDRN